eukprot:m51a1_g9614 hypothetical protein (157) ;mRNA; f:1082197-1082765
MPSNEPAKPAKSHKKKRGTEGQAKAKPSSGQGRRRDPRGVRSLLYRVGDAERAECVQEARRMLAQSPQAGGGGGEAARAWAAIAERLAPRLGVKKVKGPRGTMVVCASTLNKLAADLRWEVRQLDEAPAAAPQQQQQQQEGVAHSASGAAEATNGR